MTGKRMRNQSGESKKDMVFNIFGYKGKRDNSKKWHFPKKNILGKLYSEKNDSKKLDNFFNLPRPAKKIRMRVLGKMILLIPHKCKCKYKCNVKWWSCIHAFTHLRVFVAKRSRIRFTRFLRKVISIFWRYKESCKFYLHFYTTGDYVF